MALYTVDIPDAAYPTLIDFLDKEFPHCGACGGRFIRIDRETFCQGCVPTLEGITCNLTALIRGTHRHPVLR